MTGFLAACFGLVLGTLLGAAVQRWGDRDRATHGHKVYDVGNAAEWFV